LDDREGARHDRDSQSRFGLAAPSLQKPSRRSATAGLTARATGSLAAADRRARISPRVAVPCNLRARRLTSRPSSFGEAATGARPIAPPERPGRGVHSGPLLPLLVSHAGARVWPFDGDDAVSFPRRWCEPQSRPAPSHPSPPTCWPARQWWGSAAEPSSIRRGSSAVFYGSLWRGWLSSR